MDTFTRIKALELLRATPDNWTEEETKELSPLQKWVEDLQYISDECNRRQREAGIITISIKNKWRTIYTRELKDTLRTYIETGDFPELTSWETEAYLEADKIHKAVLDEMNWYNRE